MDIQILEVEFHNLEDDLIEKYLTFQEALHKASLRDEILRSREFRKRNMVVPPQKNSTRYRVIAIKDSLIVGSGFAGFVTREQETNKDVIRLDINIHPKYRQQGIASLILLKLLDFTEKHGKTKIDGGYYPIDSPHNEDWINKLGMKISITEKMSRLHRDKINWNWIKEQENHRKPNLEKYRVEGMSRVDYSKKILNDETFAQAMADYFTEVENLLPREEAEWNDEIITAKDLQINAEQTLKTKDNWNGYNFLLMDGSKIIAYSGTYYAMDPPIRDVDTGLTGVRKAYQRQGLATYLKILMVRHYVENHPKFEYIHTENAGSNDGMLSINYGLGFASVYEWKFIQGITESVRNYLNSK